MQSGLKAGETVVIDGQLRLAPGVKVSVKNANFASNQRTMSIPELFIRRPVMTTLVMSGILLFGLVGYSLLPVSDLPSVDYPTINVSASLPGANPETMASSVATPLEKQFSTIAGVDSMSSDQRAGRCRKSPSSSRWTATLTRRRRTCRRPSRGRRRQLPPNMPTPPTYQKVNPGGLADSVILPCHRPRCRSRPWTIMRRICWRNRFRW